MPNPTRIEVNCETGEVQEIELTDEEVAERETMAAKAEADRLVLEAEEAAKAAAKSELLAKLGISEDEAKLLLS